MTDRTPPPEEKQTAPEGEKKKRWVPPTFQRVEADQTEGGATSGPVESAYYSPS
ncbi:MAG TPA: hypothetical protein VGA70_05965 [Longimicrobiales bacterium]|jgi:hypothetical protein